ncbi:MAG: crossover junction endodeoxyribonuclease RuvC [Bacteroidales bacterium]|jgi:crossover junction endodeoxyribonuclease RuvC|nr:crossover junction endodeoxyribonuclease RuvC [Bacteroidales bacterium]
MIILGIDPGTTIMGFSIINVVNNKVTLVEMNIERMVKLTDQNAKLKRIFECTIELIDQYHPEVLAIEAPFFGKNPQSMLKLGRAQGVVIAASLSRNLEVFEYSPRKIKQSITGKGSASKEQVAAMLKNMELFTEDSRYFDATDALAVAVCHQLQNRISIPGKKYNGWESFISQNENRIK